MLDTTTDLNSLELLKNSLGEAAELMRRAFPDNTARAIALTQLEDCFGWAAKSLVKEDTQFEAKRPEREAADHTDDDDDDGSGRY